MKTFLLSLLFSFSFFASQGSDQFSAASSGTFEEPLVSSIIVEAAAIEDEGIGCKVRDSEGNVLASCIICNCARLTRNTLNNQP